jgi:hypothetical protein
MKYSNKMNQQVSRLGLCVLWTIYVIDSPFVQGITSRIENALLILKKARALQHKQVAAEELYQKAKERYGVYKTNPVFTYKYEAYKKAWG